MATKNFIKKNYYSDSVTLMMISNKVSKLQGVTNAAVMMGSDYNKSLMRDSGLLLPENKYATPNDMIVGIIADSEGAIDFAIKTVEELLENKKHASGSDELIVKTQDSAVKRLPSANFAVISIPGKFAKNEALKALDNDLNVLLFSDNVTLEEEIELKKKAEEKGLLMMGPDCGTAIINGVALGFANIVERGDIGMVAAAGTGLQEVTSLVDKFGGGVSQALGTGGRDLKEDVGGRMMLMGIDALVEDAQTKVIILISKPPCPTVMKKILKKLKGINKKVVACFLGADPVAVKDSGAIPAHTLEDAAIAAVNLSKGIIPENLFFSIKLERVKALIDDEINKLCDNQRFVRGLYCGGTLSYEAMLVMKEFIGDIYSNIAMKKKFLLVDAEKSQGNTVIDMGDDYFTDGRPHPMIDPSLRNERIKREAMDPEAGVILVDCVTGYGSHEDPAGSLAKAIKEAKKIAENEGKYISVISSICGTYKDPQARKEQEDKLRDAGALVMPSNAQAARLASFIINRGRGLDRITR